MSQNSRDLEVVQISDDDSFGSILDSASEDEALLPADEKDGDQRRFSSIHPNSSQPTPKPDTPRRSNSLTLPGQYPMSSNSSTPSALCVICQISPAYNVGPDVYPTCGRQCASKLQVATGLPSPSYSHTSGPPPPSLIPSMSENRPSPQSQLSAPTTYASQAGSHPRLNQLKMCDVCHVRPRCQRGGKIYPTCGLSCAAKMNAPGSIEMCGYCKKRPKIVINGKKYPQCGKTCRDKAQLAETAANAAACTSCIFCWRSAKAGPSDFCSQACENLANAKAPFLIEIPRGHVAFMQVAQYFTSGWQKSNTHCPTVKRIYMVVMTPGFNTSHNKYRPNGILQRKGNYKKRWLVFSRECGFGDPGDVEPCSSNKCFLCCIVRSSFSRLNFPTGITTAWLNGAIQRSRSGKKSSSKFAVLANVFAGREAEIVSHDLHVVHPIPPRGSNSVRVIAVRNDGSKFDTGDIIVYDGDAVKPLYLISYE